MSTFTTDFIIFLSGFIVGSVLTIIIAIFLKTPEPRIVYVEKEHPMHIWKIPTGNNNTDEGDKQ